MLRKLVRESLIAQFVVLGIAFLVVVCIAWGVVFVDEYRLPATSVTARNDGKSAAYHGRGRHECPYSTADERLAWLTGYDMTMDRLSNTTDSAE